MPRDKPQMSITLPRNFTFHYTEGEEPKTPEHQNTTPTAHPPSPQAYRLKRRIRPTIQTSTQTQAQLTHQLQNAPVPVIQTPVLLEPEPLRSSFEHRVTEPEGRYLAPSAARLFLTQPRPRTPTMQRVQLQSCWNTPSQKDIGDSIIRPLSRCSITSDSSDESSGSLTSYPSLGGSCTSPESDAVDPFVLPSIKKSKLRQRAGILAKPEISSSSPGIAKQPSTQWTSEMDQHLWLAYTQYLQDPTITPFKTLPGTVPPLGVCHRVARQARRTWRGQGQTSQTPSRESNERTTSTDYSIKFGDSPESTKTGRSGSCTPTGRPSMTAPVWPKSSSSTRRRLRYLARRKPGIAPHYQRLLRSPSPFSSSSRPQSRSIRASSPLCQDIQQGPPFSTRDIQLSLTTSTAVSMQPGGPLAQLAEDKSSAPQEASGWSNDPSAPWASPPAIPSSEIDREYIAPPHKAPDTMQYESPLGSPLGSPFSGSKTWGPSRSRQHIRPTTPRTQSNQVASTIGPTLRSPIKFNGRNPYPSVSKRRAQHQLEDELSPGGSDKMNIFEELFGGPPEGRHRRVRSRGFSLGDAIRPNRPEAAFDHLSCKENASQVPSDTSGSSNLRVPNAGEPVPRLGSPFSISAGGSMPTRRPSRHITSASLSSFDPGNFGNFASIDQRIRQSDVDEDFLRRLRE
ncbi:MAG: hypothetical protein L6R38_004585 [Xanthoria sp. 2 TBL-2021]|nr:MAG: hypothetical protein L6R38_004585 [Xanthoria sp. 2 TBL-2021]